MEKIEKRFNEGWAMLRRSFDFYELAATLPKLSLVYVYSERSVFRNRIRASYFKSQEFNENFWSSVPNWMQVQMDNDIHVPKEATYETYEGEIVKTVVEGVTVKLYPEEYTPVDMLQYTTTPNFHPHYALHKNDRFYLKRNDIKNKIHYLTSRGMSRELAIFYVSSLAKHAVWFKPCQALQEEFKDWEPCKVKSLNL